MQVSCSGDVQMLFYFNPWHLSEVGLSGPFEKLVILENYWTCCINGASALQCQWSNEHSFTGNQMFCQDCMTPTAKIKANMVQGMSTQTRITYLQQGIKHTFDPTQTTISTTIMTFTSSVASQECHMGDQKDSAGSTFMQLTVVCVYAT